jgi:hypothetical protein
MGLARWSAMTSLPLYVWYVRRRPRDVLLRLARRRLGALRLAYVPSAAIALRVGFWGLPNLQVINRDAHAAKCAIEARHRRVARSLETELT